MSNETTKVKYKYFAGGKGFKNKKDLQMCCKDILNSYEFDTLEGEDFNIINDVFKMHPRYDEKVGGCDYIIKVETSELNPMYNQFVIERSDGEFLDFSYYKTISGYSYETKVKETLREVIIDQQKGFRLNYIFDNKDSKGYVRCQETQLKAKPKEMHVDHYPLQFEEIVEKWFLTRGLTLKTFKIYPPKGKGYKWEFEDPDLATDFYNFHLEEAKYRFVLNKVNLQRCKAKVKLPK